MTIASTLSVLESQLARFFPYYVEVDRVELLPFETPADVVRALRSTSSLKPSERYALIAALVAEHQKRPHPLWTMILLLAFAPMIQRLRAGLGRAKDEERDQRAIFAFLEALKTLEPAGSYVAIALRRATRKALFAKTAKAEAKPELVAFDEEQHSAWDPLALSEAELRVEAAWAARRAARVEAERKDARNRVQKLPRKGRVAA
jgi:hypothetical protein